jgi:nitroreductase
MYENKWDYMKQRKSNYPISPIILNRWSPRAMTGEEISNETLMTLFEAARWAPSSFNNQPWRFIYAKRNSSYWQTFLDLLEPANQAWAKNAAVLIVMVSHNVFDYDGRPSRTHSFDAGAAWENLALQGSILGLVVHGMEGFNYDKASQVLKIPDTYTVEAMAAVGVYGNVEQLPKKLQDVDFPNDRKPLNEILFEGSFNPPVSSRA